MAPSCEHGGNGSRKRHSPKGRQIPPNSQSRPRSGRRRRTRGFPHQLGRAAGGGTTGGILRPAPFPAAAQHSRPRQPSADTAPPVRPARPQPSGPRLADRGGLHLPACRPHPARGDAARGLHIPPPRPRSPSGPSRPHRRILALPAGGSRGDRRGGGGVRAPSSAGEALPPGWSD